jgi:2-amino-4-hydroxy-6-hydroxymethyldihydropteridine diphosphokinase
LGANLGDARATVLEAMQAISSIDGVTCIRRSSLYASAPVDSSGPDYVNAVAEVKTRLTAMQLLVQLQVLELGAGRLRPYRNAPRTLDLDVLLYGQSTIQAAVLTVPHPRMWERAFVLLPLSEIAPHTVHAAALARVQTQAVTVLPVVV